MTPAIFPQESSAATTQTTAMVTTAPAIGMMLSRPMRTPSREEVPDVQDAEDNGAANAKDQHEQTLAEEPFAHADFGFFERCVQTAAILQREEREEEGVGVFAFEHEIDAEDEGGEQIEDAAYPLGKGGEEVGGRGGECAFGLLRDGVVEPELVGHGQLLDLVDDLRDASRQVIRKLGSRRG